MCKMYVLCKNHRQSCTLTFIIHCYKKKNRGPASRLFNGSQIHPKYRNRLPLPVLAARLHCTNRYTAPDEGHAGGEGHPGGDVVIAWVAGLDIGNVTAGSLRCSIQASLIVNFFGYSDERF